IAKIFDPRNEPRTYEERRLVLEGLRDLRMNYYDGTLDITGFVPVPSTPKNRQGRVSANAERHDKNREQSPDSVAGCVQRILNPETGHRKVSGGTYSDILLTSSEPTLPDSISGLADYFRLSGHWATNARQDCDAGNLPRQRNLWVIDTSGWR